MSYRLPLLLALAACQGGSISLDDAREDCPFAAIDSVVLEWTAAPLEEPETRVFKLTNNCLDDEGDLTATFVVEGEGFSVSSQGVTVRPGEVAEVGVTFFAASYQGSNGTIRIGTNDPENAEIVLPLTATVDPDQDLDGFLALDVGGDDCNDRDASIYPGAAEVWYDDIDQNCDGQDDWDADRDGFQAVPRGGDCDDADPGINPGRREEVDGRDEDCDGWIDEDFLRPGDLLVTEVMADPVVVFDTTGEWFEVTNLTDRTLYLQNWEVTDFRGDSFRIGPGVQVAAGGRLVLGASSVLGENGGAPVDTTYTRSEFELANDGDAIGLRVGENIISLLEYDLRWPVRPGASLSLDPLFVRRDTGTVQTYWCPSTSLMSGGDLGTPGAENDWCPNVDHDGDGVTPAAGDCDDRDGTVFPGAPDRWNGRDDDCNRVVDDADIADVEDGWIEGERRDYLSYVSSLSIGDVDGDGDKELLAGSTRSGGTTYEGVVYVLPASGAASWADYAYNLDEAVLTTTTTYDTMGLLGIEQADVTGDGKVDLVVSGATYISSSNPAVLVFGDASKVKGSFDERSATVTYTLSRFGFEANRVTNHTDLDGDGAAEIVMSDIYATNPAPSSGSGAYAGALYVFDATGAKGTVSAASGAARIWYGADFYDLLGSAVETADVDADGYGDTVGCANYADRSGAAYSGACYLVLGGKDLAATGRISDRSKVTLRGRTTNDRLGSAPRHVLADFDGDGTVDLGLANTFREEVLVYFDLASQGADIDTTDADVVLRPRRSAAGLGRGMAAGDFDADGLIDLVVGAPDATSYTGGGADEVGRVWMWSGATLSAATSVLDEEDVSGSVRGANTSDAFGWALLATDLDNDGADDLVIGAPGAASGAGRVSVMMGEP
jgi:hypothetical protein